MLEKLVAHLKEQASAAVGSASTIVANEGEQL